MYEQVFEQKEDKSRSERIEEKLDTLLADKKPKEKKFRMPWSAKVNKPRLKKGYITVEVINENKSISFKRYPIIDGTIKVDDTIHAVDELDIFIYKGRPFAHIPKTKINPWNPLSDYLNTERIYDGKTLSKNEIYGQKYIMARMKSDIVKTGRKIGWGVTIFGLIILGIIGYSLLKG